MAPQAIDEFLAEAEELLEKLNRDLAVLGESSGTGQGAPDLINGIFRDAHSFKGLAGMFGFDDVAELAHHLEDLLDHLRLGKISLDNNLVDCLFDTLEGLSGLLSGKADNPGYTLDISPYLARIEHLLGGQPTGPPADFGRLNIDPALLEVLTEYEEHRLQENLRQGKHLLLIKVAFPLQTFDTELAALTEAIKQDGEVISTLPGNHGNPELLAFSLLCGMEHDPDSLRQQLKIEVPEIEIVSEGRSAARTSAASVLATGMTAEVASDFPAPEAESADPPAQEGNSARSFSGSVRVDIGKLDSLMAIVGDLALAKGAISEVCNDLRLQGIAKARTLEKAVHTLDRRLNDLQAGVMDVRMVPVRQLFDKMHRIVRRMAHELGKKVKIEVLGGDTELDKLIVEDLADPLMHIIRNALDHGIESAERRAALGKPETGLLVLSAVQKGSHVVIEVRDDGKGVDPELLRQKGIEKGLLEEDADLTRQELFGLLFHPGFSTRNQVSEFSGRGIGMDVVKNNISALSGMIKLESEVGQGTAISLTLPITLAIIKALVVSVRGTDYAIPLNSVLETLMLEAGTIQTIEGREVMELRQQTLSLLRIDQLFQLAGEPSDKGQFVVVAGFADRRMGIVVDELRGQQDVVIKPLGGALSFVRGISGAADLGNQKTILVLDVGGLTGETLQLDGVIGV